MTTATYRYEARYHGADEWLPIPEWLLRRRLGAETPDVAPVIEAMHAGDEADDDAMAYRAVRVVDASDYRVVLTSAPECYDGFGTVTLAAGVGSDHAGRVLRRVGVRPEHYEWQALRYGSGLHVVASEDEARRFPQIYHVA